MSERILEKGVEVDLHTTVGVERRVAWESLNTFYYRGRFGVTDRPSPMTASPEAGDEVVDRWRTPSTGGFAFGGWTGDYNGIHWLNPYARLLGFRRAFHHPQVVVGQVLARLPAAASGAPRRLDIWAQGARLPRQRGHPPRPFGDRTEPRSRSWRRASRGLPSWAAGGRSPLAAGCSG